MSVLGNLASAIGFTAIALLLLGATGLVLLNLFRGIDD